jgi:hypothetical protein
MSGCMQCGGTGYIGDYNEVSPGVGWYTTTKPCPDCNGTGQVPEEWATMHRLTRPEEQFGECGQCGERTYLAEARLPDPDGDTLLCPRCWVEQAPAQVQALAQALVDAREVQASAESYATVAEVELRQTEAWRRWDELARTAVDAACGARAAEERLRMVALEVYGDTHKARLAPGVTIKLRHLLDYDQAAAIAWCEENMPVLVTTVKRLDARQFEKAIKGLDDAPVTPRDEPYVTLAADLAKALQEAPEEASDASGVK